MAYAELSLSVLTWHDARNFRELLDDLALQRKRVPSKSTGAKPRSKKVAATAKPAASGNLIAVVGIGASAGGLKALEDFFRNVPTDTGMAFVVVQHLDPVQKGMMAEILARTSRLRVQTIEQSTPLKPNQVFVIPPNKDLEVVGGVLKLCAFGAPRGHRLPIDHFFMSLAEDCGTRAVGVVLSGMGSDGCAGLRAIKSRWGFTLAQDPSSAEYESMPHSAIAAGVVDVVASAAELPVRLLARFGQLPVIEREVVRANGGRTRLNQVLAALQQRTGRDFSTYKTASLTRRIERRMALHQIGNFGEYERFVRANPHELDLLFHEILIGVTSFFRDPPVWSALIEQALPALFALYPEGKALRAWVPGCSTGEEAYSLAMAFHEAAQGFAGGQRRFSLHIFATDLDADAIAKARQGFFAKTIASDVGEVRLQRYFVPEDGAFRVVKEIREMVTFAEQDLVNDSPFTKLDLISCRNLLIYLNGDTQKRLLPLLHYSLNHNGLLVLGSAETIGSYSHLFTPIDSRLRIYRRTGIAPAIGSIDFPTGTVPGTPEQRGKPLSPRVPNLQTLADRLVLEHFAPPAVLVNDRGDILYVSGRTGRFLEPAAGKANWNVHAMARDGLRNVIGGALHRALRETSKIVIHDVAVGGEGQTFNVDISVQAISEPPPLAGMALIVFAEAPPLRRAQARRAGRSSAQQTEIDDLREALRQAQEEGRVLHEEMESAREELKSANEELQSNNEELQSTNEELTSSREEMQSMNEELQAINAELQAKVDDLLRASDDMKNLLDSSDIATVFLDSLFNVRRFTSRATRLFRLIPTDVGRPLGDVATLLDYPGLLEDAREVMKSLVFKTTRARAQDGRWFKVRILPYRTQNNVIDGVVMTFTDLSVVDAGPAPEDAPAETDSNARRGRKKPT